MRHKLSYLQNFILLSCNGIFLLIELIFVVVVVIFSLNIYMICKDSGFFPLLDRGGATD